MTAADSTGVTMTDIVTSSHIDDVLGSLPETTMVAESGTARLVMATTGIFVVMPATPDILGSTDQAHWLAAETRDVLATHLAWIPFVDAVVVCGDTPINDALSATVVPIDLLSDLLCEGLHIVSTSILHKIRLLIDRGGLAAWNVEQRSESATIDLCTQMTPAIET